MLAVKARPPWTPLSSEHPHGGTTTCSFTHPLTGEPSAAHKACRRQACFPVGKLRQREAVACPLRPRLRGHSTLQRQEPAASQAHLWDQEPQSVCPAHPDVHAQGLDAREPCLQPSRTPWAPGRPLGPPAESLGTDSLGPASGASVSRREDEKVLVGQGLCTPGPGAGAGMLLPSQPQRHTRGCGSPGAAEDSDPPNTPPREEAGCRGLPRHT